MRSKICVFVGVASLALLAYAGAASALTLGAARPLPASPSACGTGLVVGQFTDDPSTPYHIPAGGGTITQWQTNTSKDSISPGGAQVTFVVLAPPTGDNYPVVGVDSETLPAILPTSGIVSYTLSSPIAVSAGDTLGIYSAPSSTQFVVCYWDSGATPLGDSVMALTAPSFPLSAGETLTITGGPHPAGWAANLQATLLQNEDAGVTTSAWSSAKALQVALLSSTVTNNGPAAGPITFTDTLPSGLKVYSAGAAGGSCSWGGHKVTCSFGGLSPGQRAPVDVLVTPSAAGSYTSTASVAVPSGDVDSNSANNRASATLSVGKPVLVPECVVPKLKGVSARFATTALKDLGCRVKTKRKHSKAVHKGNVIKTSPGKGTYAHHRKVTLIVSSGR